MSATIKPIRVDESDAYFHVYLYGRRIGFLCMARRRPFRGETIPYRYFEDDWGDMHYDQPVRASRKLGRSPKEAASMVEQSYLRRHKQVMREIARANVRRQDAGH